MTIDQAREMFPGALRVERVQYNGKPAIKIVTKEDGHETWHYLTPGRKQ